MKDKKLKDIAKLEKELKIINADIYEIKIILYKYSSDELVELLKTREEDRRILLEKIETLEKELNK